MTRIGRRGSWAGYVLVAGIAVAAAGGGLASAARSGGGTIHACVNKQTGALTLARKCNSATERHISWSVRGPKGPKGVKGATGATGATGPTGPSDAWEKTSQTEADATTTPVTLSVTVPAGSYDITGKAQEQNWDSLAPAALNCTLAAGAGLLDQTFSTAVAQGAWGFGDATNVVHGSFTATANTTFTFSCKGSNGATKVYVNDPTLSAIKVGTIH